MSLSYLLRFVKSNGPSSIFSPAHIEISVFLGDSYPPKNQFEYPKRHFLSFISQISTSLYFSSCNNNEYDRNNKDKGE